MTLEGCRFPETWEWAGWWDERDVWGGSSERFSFDRRLRTGDDCPHSMAAARGSLSVRRAAIEDLDDLVALEHLSFAPDRRRISRRQWSYLVRRGSGVTFVALEAPGDGGHDPTLVAALVATHREGGSTLRIYSLAVHPEARRRGLARLLLNEVESYGRGRGFRRVYLEVAVDNAPAIALYCSAGFATRSRLAHYYGFDEDGWRMEKELSADESASAVRKLDGRAV